MVEWHVDEALDDNPPPPDTPRRRFGRRERVIVGGVMVLALAFMVGIARWRQVQAERTIEQDLLAVIQAEEQARRFGMEDQASQFISADAPAAWRDRFTRTFTPTISTAVPLPVAISLVSVRLEGQEAAVLVQVGQQLQERRYRLTEEGWQRVPVVAEGRGDAITLSPSTLTLTYQESDAPFAETFSRDLPALQAQIRVWGGDASSPTIEIHSEEFYPPAYYVNFNDTYRLSSPRVVTLPVHWDMTGEEAVRYRFAKALWHTVPDSDISNRRLPGASRFVLATQTLLSLKWAVSEENYQGFLNRWHNQQSSGMTSALYQRPTHSGWMDIFAPSPEEAATLLFVDAIYTKSGADGLAAIAQRMTDAEEWDTVLRPVTGMTTRQLLTIAVGGTPDTPSFGTAVVAGSPTISEGWGSRYYQMSGEGDAPVWVERTIDSDIVLNNIETLPEECAVLFSDVTVEGTWREEGLRLTAERYRTNGDLLPLPPAPTLPPTDTQFYVSRLGNLGVFPSYGQLAAVRADDSMLPLWSGRPLAFEALNQDDALMRRGITIARYPGPACQEVVFYRWEPQAGVVGAWMAHVPNGFGNLSVWWDSFRHKGLLTRTLYNAVDTETWYWWLNTDQPLLANEPDGRIPGGPVIALRPNSTQVLLDDVEQNRLILFDVTADRPLWERDYGAGETHSNVVLDATGTFLYVVENRTGIVSRSALVRYSLETGRSDSLLEDDVLSGVGAIQVDAVSGAVYAITDNGEERTLIAIAEAQVHTLYTYAPGELSYQFLSCRGGGALFTTFLPPRFDTAILAPQIRRIAPNGTLQPDVLPMNDYGVPLLCQ